MKFNIIKMLFNNKNKQTKPDAKEDSFISMVGHFGKWQFIIFASIILVKLSSAWVQLMILFLTPKSSFRCAEFKMNSSRIAENMTCYSHCLRYNYDTSPFSNTIVSEWDLVCERQWLASFTQTVLQFGILVGSSVFGFLSDRYGRRYTFLSSIIILLVFGFCLPYSPSYTLFTIYRFFLGTATAGTMVISFVIIVEIIGPKYREIAGCIYQIPFILGHLALPLFAYYLRNWNEYTLGLAIPPLIYLVYFVVIPETPRWLMLAGKVDETVKLVTKAAKMNNLPTANIKEIVSKVSNDMRNRKSEEPKLNFLDLVRTRSLRIRTFCSFIIWLVSGFSFFGVNQYISQTSPNPFVSVAAAAAVQLPANILAMWLLRKLGRKISIIGSLSLGGVCMILLGFVPDIYWLKLTLGTLGVSCFAFLCTAIYIYSTELFPTVVRNMGLGLSSTAMRCGAMLAPFVSNLSWVVGWLPALIFGVAPILTALLCFMLPETVDKELPDTIEEIEE